MRWTSHKELALPTPLQLISNECTDILHYTLTFHQKKLHDNSLFDNNFFFQFKDQFKEIKEK